MGFKSWFWDRNEEYHETQKKALSEGKTAENLPALNGL